MNEDYTLTTFAEPITALADDPQLPPDEMKRRLQAPADELRQAHNALARTVKGITDATYPDTVTRDMLTQDVRDELDSKADADDVSDEVNALDIRLDAVEDALPQKCACYFGTYNGDGAASREIVLGYRPKAVLLVKQDSNFTYIQNSYGYCYGGLFYDGSPLVLNYFMEPVTCAEITNNGFKVYQLTDGQTIGSATNDAYGKYFYMALK